MPSSGKTVVLAVRPASTLSAVRRLLLGRQGRLMEGGGVHQARHTSSPPPPSLSRPATRDNAVGNLIHIPHGNAGQTGRVRLLISPLASFDHSVDESATDLVSSRNLAKMSYPGSVVLKTLNGSSMSSVNTSSLPHPVPHLALGKTSNYQLKRWYLLYTSLFTNKVGQFYRCCLFNTGYY